MTKAITTALTVFIIVFAVLVVVWVVWLAYQYCKGKTLDDIRSDVYQLFLRAEKKFKSGEGEEKMAWVVEKARDLLPAWLKIFITQDSLTRIIQIWFDGIKDLLDDGKINGSTAVEEEGEEAEEETDG